MAELAGASSHSVETDIAIVGGGPAGLTAAIALAQRGASVTLIARRAPYGDNRTTALLGESVAMLDDLDIWRRCRDSAAPLREMRLVDDTRRLIRAPELRFASEEIGLDAFGYNIANADLLEALEQRAAELASLRRIEADAAFIDPMDERVQIAIAGGASVAARLVIGADGRQSKTREAAGIRLKSRALDQAALTLSIAHARPHRDASTEFHTEQGPCVFVPLPGNRSSIVWVTRPEEAERLMALPDEALSRAVEIQSQSILGRVTMQPGRWIFPLVVETADRVAARRIVLVGDAGHALPPIGAQGLNLGLRDATDIARIAGDAVVRGNDPGSATVLRNYEFARRADIASRTAVIDLANRSLLSDLLPVQAMRSAGLSLIGGFGPLRRLAMREGLAPSWRSGRPPPASASADHGSGI